MRFGQTDDQKLEAKERAAYSLDDHRTTKLYWTLQTKWSHTKKSCVHAMRIWQLHKNPRQMKMWEYKEQIYGLADQIVLEKEGSEFD